MSLEYVWTNEACGDTGIPPGPGWTYQGGSVRDVGGAPRQIIRWGRPGGHTLRERDWVAAWRKGWPIEVLGPYTDKEIAERESVTPVTQPVTTKGGVTPPEATTKPKGLAWALQLLRT